MEKIKGIESRLVVFEKKFDRILYHSDWYALVLEELGKAHNIDMGEYCPPSISEQVVEDENTPATHEQEEENASSESESGSSGSAESEEIGSSRSEEEDQE